MTAKLGKPKLEGQEALISASRDILPPLGCEDVSQLLRRFGRSLRNALKLNEHSSPQTFIARRQGAGTRFGEISGHPPHGRQKIQRTCRFPPPWTVEELALLEGAGLQNVSGSKPRPSEFMWEVSMSHAKQASKRRSRTKTVTGFTAVAVGEGPRHFKAGSLQ
jgi:hypothetical protein